MEKIIKFNQRAQKVNEDATEFAFAIQLRATQYCFAHMNNGSPFVILGIKLLNNKFEETNTLKLNEWKIYDIQIKTYYGRKVVYFRYVCPKSGGLKLESGGRTFDYETNLGLDDLSALVEDLLEHFYRLTFFNNLSDLKNEIARLENLKKFNAADALNFQYLRTDGMFRTFSS